MQWTTIKDSHTVTARMASQEDTTNILGNLSAGDVRYGSLGPIHQGDFTVYKAQMVYSSNFFHLCCDQRKKWLKHNKQFIQSWKVEKPQLINFDT